MRYPDPDQIQEAFVRLAASQTRGVSAVLELDSGLPGPTVYIGVCTQGNERFGVAAITPLVLGWVPVVSGKLRLVVNNLQAALNETRRFPVNSADDMNRLPAGLLDDASVAEGFQARQRVRELHQAGLLDCEVGVDVHTLYTPSDSVLLPIKGPLHYFDRLPVSHSIHGIVDAQVSPDGVRTVAFGSFLGGALDRDIPVLELEGGGPHDSEAVIHRLVDALSSLLIHLCVIDGELEEVRMLRKAYTVVGSLWAPEAGYCLTKDWIHEEAAPCGTVFAENSGGAILEVPPLPEAQGCPMTFLFPSVRCNRDGSLRPLNVFSEATFLGISEEKELNVWKPTLV